MRKMLIFIFIFIIAGCKEKSADEVIKESVASLTAVKKNNYNKILFIKSNNFYPVRVFQFSVYNYAHKEKVFALVDTNNNVRIIKNREEILGYIKSSTSFWYNWRLKKHFNTSESNDINRYILDLLDLYYWEKLINQKEDINGYNELDKKRLTKVNIYPMKKTNLGDRIEVRFFTWDYSNLDLFENIITISDSLTWKRNLVMQDVGGQGEFDR
ncbi:MAG: hypothetical protein ACM3MI_10485 [Clostridiales bacterium]